MLVWLDFKGIWFIWVYFTALQKAHEGVNTDSPNVPPAVLMAPTLHHKKLHLLFGEMNWVVGKAFARDLSAPSMRSAGKMYFTQTIHSSSCSCYYLYHSSM